MSEKQEPSVPELVDTMYFALTVGQGSPQIMESFVSMRFMSTKLLISSGFNQPCGLAT
jgi:hypothetical protein